MFTHAGLVEVDMRSVSSAAVSQVTTPVGVSVAGSCPAETTPVKEAATKL